MDNRPVVAIVIIGDEILKGQTYDTNSHFLCKELYELGVRVNRVVVIPDIVDTIAEEIRYCSKHFSFVLTSGGIGPTHDDVTYSGVAKAFNEKLVKNNELASILFDWFKSVNISHEAIEKICKLPQSAQLHYPKDPDSKDEVFPIVSVYNVFVFPGIPTYMEFSFQFLKNIFVKNNAKIFYTRELYLNIEEINISEQLSLAAKKFEKKVQIGSYPKVLNDIYRVQLTLEGDSSEDIEKAEIFLRQTLPSNKIVSPCDAFSIENIELLYSFKFCSDEDAALKSKVQNSIEILEDCLQRYNLNEICISFNGGKDCTLLLHLACLVFFKNKGDSFQNLTALYIRPKEPFPEIEDFIKDSIERYKLNLISYPGPIKNGLTQFQKDYPQVKATLMGVRASDPTGTDLKPFTQTDPAWGNFMRVSPILDWNYSNVWTVIRKMNIPYCSLYDLGYSSLGNKSSTTLNQKLFDPATQTYRPAYLLKEDTDERNSRLANN